MSGNSCESCLQTAPMVSDLACWRGASSGPAATSSPVAVSSDTATSAGEVGQFVLADLQLVAVFQLVRVDPAPVDIGPVQRAAVVEVPGARAAHQHGVVARHRDVVE